MSLDPEFRIPLFEQVARAPLNRDSMECTDEFLRDDLQYENCVVNYYRSFPAKGGIDYDPSTDSWKHAPVFINMKTGEIRPYDGSYELPTHEEDNWTIIVFADGVVEISSFINEPAYDGDWLESAGGIFTTILSGIEVGELEKFICSVDCKRLKHSACYPRKLSDLVDEVFLLIPDSASSAMKLYPFHPKMLRGVDPITDFNLNQFFGCEPELPVPHDKLLDFVQELGVDPEKFGMDPDDLTPQLPGIVRRFLTSNSDFAEFVQERMPEGVLGEEVMPKPDDLVLSIDFGPDRFEEVNYFEQVEYLNKSAPYHWGPLIVFRLKENVSRMWLIDYLKFAEEADGLIKRIFTGWKHLPRGLSRISVDLPKSLNDQTASAIARRGARSSYHRFLGDLMKLREPFSEMQKVYQRRRSGLEVLHSDYLDDLVAQQKPLPFFLEYPHRVYRRETDPFKKLRAGKRLLGVLAKIPLFLVLEELLALDDSLGEDILSFLESSPPSDGTLVSMHAKVAKEIDERSEMPLRVFSNLIGFLRENQPLMEIVQRRNRLNHEPFDLEGFFEILDSEVPKLIERLRDTLSECRFIIPSGMKLENGKKIVSGENICSPDSMFEKVDFETTLGLEDFPNDELIAYVRGSEQTVRLGKLVMAKTILEKSHDFGVFDRVDKKNKRHFVFLRSDMEG